MKLHLAERWMTISYNNNKISALFLITSLQQSFPQRTLLMVIRATFTYPKKGQSAKDSIYKTV